MKAKRIGLLVILIAGALPCWSQTADRLVLEGRARLKGKDLKGAYEKFRQAVEVNPNHDSARVLAATTRLLTAPDTEAGQDMMDRLGIDLAGRNLFNWTATFPTNREGNVVVPNQFSAEEPVRFLRMELFSAVATSLEDLGRVNDRFFLVTLSEDETSLTDVTIDYGDIQILRSLLHALRGAILTVHAHNLDVQLNVLASLRDSDLLSAESLTQYFPEFMATARPGDLGLVRSELTKSLDLYHDASALLWQRPTNVVRLFNFDPESRKDEAEFRDQFEKLVQSFDRPSELIWGTNSNERVSVHVGPFFSGEIDLRQFAPEVRGNAIIPGTFLDPTFGGVLPEMGGQAYVIDELLSRGVDFAPAFETPWATPGSLNFRLRTATPQVIETSSDLVKWLQLGVFEPDRGVIVLSVPFTSGRSLFLRAREL